MKRIIVCSDGTWNKPGNRDKGVLVQTNVEKIYKAIDNVDAAGVKQLKFYHTGVGNDIGKINKIIGGATGAGIDKSIKDGYKFILANYEIGDQIYLFGFSRGAYTVRSIAGLIRNCGILKKENLHLVDEAYDNYRNRNAYSNPDSDVMKSFRNDYCVEPLTLIYCVGVWDTVGALGIPSFFFQEINAERYKFHDVVLSSTVGHAYHAIAIDEIRHLFKPTIWKKSKSVRQGIVKQDLEQCYFAGVHSNVGGGYKDAGLSDIALEWMINKSKNLGLCFDEEYIKKHVDPNAFGVIRNSRTPLFWITKAKRRFIKTNADYNTTIHESVLNRMKHAKNYKPKNVLAAQKHGQ